MRTWVFMGLGNPGKKYEMTRHNMGFLVIKAFAKELNCSFEEERRFHAFVARGRIKENTFHLLLPTTYMNRSGEAIKAYFSLYKLAPSHLVVVVDDIAHSFGEMTLKPKGSPGGHNGLKSIQAYLGTSEYFRLRMGIGDERDKETALSDYVLDSFTQEERVMLDDVIKKGVGVLHRLLIHSPDQVMKEVNTKSLRRHVNDSTKTTPL